MKKRIVSLSLALLIGAGGVFGSTGIDNVQATSYSQQIKEKQQERSKVNAEKKVAEDKMREIEAEQEKVEAEVKRLDLAVADTQDKIRTKEKEITNTKAEIAQLEKEIAELIVRIQKRDDLLKTRVRSVQENGGTISYLDVLLGADSFGDFIDRISAVSTIVQQDKDILKQHRDDKVLLEEKKTEVETKLAELQDKKAQLEKLQKQLKSQINQKNALMADLEEEHNHLEKEALSLAEEAANLKAQEEAVRKMKAAYEAEQRRLAEEAKKKSNGSSGSTAPSGGSKPAATSGAFMRPANGPITSNFGQRWGKLHAGVDIGKRGTSVPIVAVANGTVFRSYYSSSYGNTVFITHNINGQIFTSVYAHMENRMVSSGQSVKKGQQLGYMGNTGRSFGAHLHFELHKGTWNLSKSNAVNPRSYIPF